MLSALPLTSCSGDISEYVGTWRCEISYENTVSIYWGSEKVTDSRNVSGANVGLTLIINADRSVQYAQPSADFNTGGRISVIGEKARFYDVSFSSDYKFKLKTNSDGKKELDYSWSEDRHCLDCTEKRRRIVFVEKIQNN